MNRAKRLIYLSSAQVGPPRLVPERRFLRVETHTQNKPECGFRHAPTSGCEPSETTPRENRPSPRCAPHSQRHTSGNAEQGPVNTKDASANEAIGVQSKAHGAAKAIRLGETCNAALRPNGLVPEGLFPKRPCAALQSLAGCPPRLRFAPCSRPFEEQRIWHL